MQPFYENIEDNLEIYHKKSSHISPHLHTAMECILVTEGTLELGVAQELYHMNTGDFAIVFPEMVHHYQVFDSSACKALYLMASPSLSGGFQKTLHQYCPKEPVIAADNVHADIRYAMNSLLKFTAEAHEQILHQSYIQIILARSFPCYHLIEKNTVGSDDIIYQTVAYVAGHFMEEISLTKMARDLGYSPYAISRVFSGTFHTSFNQYVNNLRLEHVCSLLQYTSQSVTEAYENAGFTSQRTFNRAFKDRYRMTPREYRNLHYAAQKFEENTSP